MTTAHVSSDANRSERRDKTGLSNQTAAAIRPVPSDALGSRNYAHKANDTGHLTMSKSITIQTIVSTLDARPSAGLKLDQPIHSLSALTTADEHALSWVDSPKWLEAARSSRAAAIVVSADSADDLPNHLVVPDVQSAMADLLELFDESADRPPVGIHPAAHVDPGASVDLSASVGPFAVVKTGATIGPRTIVGASVSIGRGVVIGSDCRLHDHAVIYDRCTLGDRVSIHSNTVIGADGFGYIFRGGQHRKLRHIGTVVIEDDVEIGACATIDRAKVGETRIGRGTKIDNHVQVAHNAQVGPLCILVAQVGLSGSVRLGVGCALGGQAGVTEGVHLADGTRIAAQSGVMTDIRKPQQTVMGTPAQEHMTHKRELLELRRLSLLKDRVNALEKKVASLEGATDH